MTEMPRGGRSVAREAAIGSSLDDDDRTTTEVKAADAASDAWEPLLRDLLFVIDELPHQHTKLRQSMPYARAKEALDG